MRDMLAGQRRMLPWDYPDLDATLRELEKTYGPSQQPLTTPDTMFQEQFGDMEDQEKQSSLNNRSTLGQSTAGESGLQIYMAPWSVNGDDAWGEVGSYYGDNPPRPQRKLVTVGEKHAAELGEFGRGFVQEFIGRPEHELYRAAKLASDYAPEIAEELAPLLKQAISPAGLWGAIRGGAGNAVSKARAGASQAGNFLTGRSQAPGVWGALSRNVVGPAAQGSAQLLQSTGKAVPLVKKLVPKGMGNVATGSRGFLGNAAREAGGIGTAMGLGYGADRAAEAMGIEGGLGFAEMAGLLRAGHGLNRLGAGVNAGKKPLDPLIVGRHNAQGNPALQAAFDKQIRNRSLGNAGRTLGGNAMQAAGQGIVGHSVGEGLGVSADMLTRNIGLGDYHLRDRLPQVFGGMGATRGLFSGLGNRLTQGERGSPLERLVGDYIPGALNVSHPGWVTTGGGLATAGLAARAGQTALAKQTDELVGSEPFNQAMAELRTAESQLAQLQQAGAGPAELAQAQQSLEAAQGKVQQFTEGKADMVAAVAPQLSDANARMKDIGLHKLHTLTEQLDPVFEQLTGRKLSEFDLLDPNGRQEFVGVVQTQLQTAEQAQAAVMQAAEDLKKPLLEMAANNPEYQQRLAAMGPEELAAELGGLVGQAQQMGVQLDENGKLAMPGGGLLAGIPFLEDMGPWGTLAVLLGAGMVLGGLMSGGGGEGGGNMGLMGGLALGGLALGAPYLMDWWNSQGTAAPPAEAGAVPDEQLSQAPPPPGPQGQAGTQPGFAEHGDEAAVAAPPPPTPLPPHMTLPRWMELASGQ